MMEGSSHFRGILLSFVLFLFASTTTLCQAEKKITHLEVVGNGECADCAKNNIHTTQAFAGLQVTIECLSGKGEYKRRGVGKLDKEGKFKVTILDNEGLNEEEECYARLHSALTKPCPTQDDLKSSKIVFKQESNGKRVFSTSGKLRFSTTTCVSAFWWPHYHCPPLPKLPPFPQWKKPLPLYPSLPPKVYTPIYSPPIYTKPLPPPVYENPLPPPVPVYENPLPPPVPVYTPKPPVPVYTPKPIPPSTPIYKNPCPPIVTPSTPPTYLDKPKFPLPPYGSHP